MIFIALPTLVLVSAMTLLIARRGRRVDDHPVCRRCQYDLTGTIDHSKICPECGADLSKGRAVRSGNRVRKTWLVYASSVVLMASGVGLGVMTYRAVREIDIIRHAPMWWVIRQAEQQPPSARAAQEIRRRWTGDELSNSDTRRVARHLLWLAKDQKRSAAPFPVGLVGWGPLMQRAKANGDLSEEEWNAFWSDAIPLYIRARRETNGRQQVLVDVGCAGFDSRQRMDAAYRVTRLRVGDIECNPVDLGGSVRNLPNWAFQGGGSGEREIPLVAVPNAPAVQLPVRCTFEAEVTEYPNGASDRAQLITKATCERETTIALPAGYRPVTAVRDAGLLKAMRESVGVANVQVHHSDDDSMNADRVTVDIKVDHPPVGLAIDVTLCRPGEDSGWDIGSFVSAANETTTHRITAPVIGFDRTNAKIVLRPNLSRAAKVGMTSAFARELIIEEVPVQRPAR